MENLSKSPMPNNSLSSSYTSHSSGSLDSYGLSEREFFQKLKRCMYDNSELDSFMEDAEYHPPYGWHKFMLYVHHIQSSSQTFHIDASTLSNFLDELVTNFPDVLQRVLLRGAYENVGEHKFGAVHVSALCCHPKIVELLTKLESKVIIKNCLTECLKRSKDEYKIIERALLWSNLKRSTEDSSHSHSMVQFMKRFKAAVRSDNKEALGSLIADANLQPKDGWQTVLLWASASGENHIVRKFKDECSQLFIDIKEKSQKDGFSPLRTSSTRARDMSTKAKQDLYDLVNDLIDRGDDTDYRELLAQNLHYRTGHGWTPLHMVVILQNEAMLSTLMESYDSYQTWGKVADRLDNHNKALDSKQQKKKYGYSYNDFSDDFWMTPLHYAVIGGDENIANKVLNWETFKPHVNAFNLFVCTAFHMACRRQEGSSLMELLLMNSLININVQDCCSFSPLHWAVYVGATNCIRSLLTRAEVDDINRPMKMNEEDIHGRSAFSLAMDNGIWKLLTCIPEVKQEIERLYRDRQVYVDAANAVSVGAALIAGVTYAGWSQPITASYDYHYVEVYWAFNSLSFFFSIGALMAGIATVLPMEDIYIGKGVKSIREWLIFTSFIMIISIVFVLGAFTSAGFASLDSPHSRLKKNLLITSCIGCCLCGILGIFFLIKLYTINREWSHRYFLYLVNYIRENLCCIQKQFGLSFLPIIHKLKPEFVIKEDWNIIGKEWKGKELKWKKTRGIHHLSQVSTSVCRKCALHNDRFAYDELLLECNRLKEIGAVVAEEIENIECEQWTPKNETTKIRHLLNIDEE